MKRKITALILASALALSLGACADGETEDGTVRASDTTIAADEATGAFTITTEDGAVTSAGSVYTVTAAGTYALKGYLEGQIVVDAGDGAVELDLFGATIKCASDAPVKILSADSVDVSAKKGTENVVTDLRGAIEEGESAGAIDAACDLKLKGAGILVVTGNAGSGVRTTKDLTVQKLSLKVTAHDDALHGGDSVTVESGTVVAISTHGDAVVTKNTDANKAGKTRGDIVIAGGTVAVYAAGDGFDAAHDFVMSEGESGGADVAVCTGTYSAYTASDAATTSYKGVKAQNEVNVAGGAIDVKSYDDGLHADAGASFDAGGTGLGAVTISGGTVTMNVYAPEGKTGGGKTGPGGWSGQQSVSGADAIHADGDLTISGGTVNVDSAYEGLEANVVTVSGGTVRVSGNDDGVNACKGAKAPQIIVTGGLLDVTAAANGDVDGIDSNGTYVQTGGVVITRGPSSDAASALDADGTVTVSGGTLIVLGSGRVTTEGAVAQIPLSLHAAGSHTVKIDGATVTFTNAQSYGRTACYSDVTVTAR